MAYGRPEDKGKRLCSNCEHCRIQDVGYSELTITGVRFYCVLGLGKEFEEYSEGDEDKFAEGCKRFVLGDPIELGIEDDDTSEEAVMFEKASAFDKLLHALKADNADAAHTKINHLKSDAYELAKLRDAFKARVEALPMSEVLVVRGDGATMEALRDVLFKLAAHFKLIIVVPEGVKFESLDEDKMLIHGWKKVSP